MLFDFDGTLTPIVERPDLASLSQDIRELLKVLARRYKVGIISGRSIADIKGLVGLRRIYYSGNHGFEISGAEIRLVRPQAKRVQPLITKLCEELSGELGNIKDVIIENKELTASVHYRLVEHGKIKNMRKILERTAKPYINSGAVKVAHGKKVFEIMPNIDWDKGKAVLWIMNVVDPEGKLMPVYIGDDRTDEDAFLALEKRGITILVSEKPKKSHAKFYLKNVDEVKEFLEKLVKFRRTDQVEVRQHGLQLDPLVCPLREPERKFSDLVHQLDLCAFR